MNPFFQNLSKLCAIAFIPFTPNSFASDGTYSFNTNNWQDTGAAIAGVWAGTFTCNSQAFMLGTGNQVHGYSLANGLEVETIFEEPLYCLVDGQTVAIVLDDAILTLRDMTRLAESNAGS